MGRPCRAPEQSPGDRLPALSAAGKNLGPEKSNRGGSWVASFSSGQEWPGTKKWAPTQGSLGSLGPPLTQGPVSLHAGILT